MKKSKLPYLIWRLGRLQVAMVSTRVKKIFNGKIIDSKLNTTLIVLIPKQFKPISLCSMLCKLVMKEVVNRFRTIFPKIIGQEQVGFIAGRSIVDNVIIEQEVFHSMRSKKNLH
ncbi:Retrovirus-related Pol polyprotein from type-2 retrotransposable element R2DM [Gossypium australe]|uniref:Retrovirus-related Pol polyprotein from type-2 retrotransposable element R2DM n=1 Tax=Gossypium australe TaxID=47621 RepID=A0A5B6W765_9ROSI|nr:Retrovirus-related Pol polyprotein from type-2 retrotransposable element R2DM [Gossypium australe]